MVCVSVYPTHNSIARCAIDSAPTRQEHEATIPPPCGTSEHIGPSQSELVVSFAHLGVSSSLADLLRLFSGSHTSAKA